MTDPLSQKPTYPALQDGRTNIQPYQNPNIEPFGKCSHKPCASSLGLGDEISLKPFVEWNGVSHREGASSDRTVKCFLLHNDGQIYRRQFFGRRVNNNEANMLE